MRLLTLEEVLEHYRLSDESEFLRLGQFFLNHYRPDSTDAELFYCTDQDKIKRLIIERYGVVRER